MTATTHNPESTTDNANCDKEQSGTFPDGFHMIQNFISTQEESSKLLDEINNNSWSSEGFVHKRKMQKYIFSNDKNGNSSPPPLSKENSPVVPPILKSLVQRFLATHRKFQHPHQIIVEELTHQNRPTATPEEQLTVFESISTDCKCYMTSSSATTEGSDGNHSECCNCYVAQLCLVGHATQALHLPEQRHPECWNVQKHMDVQMKPNSLCIKTQDSLWNWRYNIACSRDNKEQKVILIKLNGMILKKNGDSSICQDEQSLAQAMSNLGVLERNAITNDASEHKSEILQNENEMPSMSELMTIIITTSPIKSHPSTELLEKTMETFELAGLEFAQKCPKVIVCDGCRVFEEDDDSDEADARDKNGQLKKPKKVTRKHANTKQALRNGIATSHQAENYQHFKQALQQKCQAGEAPFYNTSVVELPSRHGYGFALRHALRHNVSTPYVCVIQHDRTFMRPTPIKQALTTIYKNRSKVKYIGINMRSNLMYGDIFLSKYGKTAHDELSQLILRPPELLLPSDMWGPKGSSVQSMECTTSKIRRSIDSLAQTYSGCVQATEQEKWLKDNPTPDGFHQLTLTPTVFWYDNTHICETAFYRDFIFDPKNKMVAKGGFVEDKLSPVIVKSAERLGLAQGHGKFGCYILDDHSGMFFTGHLDGGAYLTTAEKKKFSEKKKMQTLPNIGTIK